MSIQIFDEIKLHSSISSIPTRSCSLFAFLCLLSAEVRSRSLCLCFVNFGELVVYLCEIVAFCEGLATGMFRLVELLVKQT